MTQYVVTDYGVEPNSEKLQTATVQAVLDRCKNDGGQVVFPAGEYIVSSLFVYSNTQIPPCQPLSHQKPCVCREGVSPPTAHTPISPTNSDLSLHHSAFIPPHTKQKKRNRLQGFVFCYS